MEYFYEYLILAIQPTKLTGIRSFVFVIIKKMHTLSTKLSFARSVLMNLSLERLNTENFPRRRPHYSILDFLFLSWWTSIGTSN